MLQKSGNQQPHHQQQQQPQRQQQQQQANSTQPRVVVIRRHPYHGFGFTVRHFIAYEDPFPQEMIQEQQVQDPNRTVNAMDTIFIFQVHPNGPAEQARLVKGDRILMVNNIPVVGISYNAVILMIKQTPIELTLHVVDRQSDVLQMYYQKIAHTPASNRSIQIPRPMPSSITVGNGNAAGALVPFNSSPVRTFPQLQQQSMISFPTQSLTSSSSSTSSATALTMNQKGSRSGSIASTTSSSFRPLAVGANSIAAAAVTNFGDMTQNLQHHHNGAYIMRGENGNNIATSISATGSNGGFMRSQPANLTVLSRQQQQQHQQKQQHQQQQQNTSGRIYSPPSTSAAAAAAAATAAAAAGAASGGAYTTDNSDLMIRLRESIKQKEEFLKSPLPHAHQQHHHQHQQQQHQHFFPHTPPSSSPQLSTSVVGIGASNSSATLYSSATGLPRGQVRTLVKQPLSVTTLPSERSGRDLLPASCDLQNFYAKNLTGNFSSVDSIMSRSSSNNVELIKTSSSSSSSTTTTTATTTGAATFSATTNQRSQPIQQQQYQQRFGNGSSGPSAGNNGTAASAAVSSSAGGNGLRDKYHKELDYLETLQETGVTNKVFERKLVSHMAKGFDPFKPLSINTNAMETPTGGALVAPPPPVVGNVMLVKKPMLYDSLQHHPLHQLQAQQLQQSTTLTQQEMQQLPQSKLMHHLNTTTTTTESPTTSSNNRGISGASVVDGQHYSRMEIHKASFATTTISSSGSGIPTTTDSSMMLEHMPSTVSEGVTRRFKPISSFDDNKPMRRISYLRATNNENEYPTSSSDTSSSLNTTTASMSGGEGTVSTDTFTPITATEAVAAATTTPTRIETRGGATNVREMTTQQQQQHQQEGERSRQQSIETETNRIIATDTEPMYDVVASEREIVAAAGTMHSGSFDETVVGTRTGTNISGPTTVTAAAAVTTAAAVVAALPLPSVVVVAGSRRSSMNNSEIRNSVNVDILSCDFVEKYETRDVNTELEVFETEMEIKSTCINGKRSSEYRSWRQVKIEIKGDTLRIYPSRSTKTDNHVIELDIRNFKIFEEEDKKKYVFRIQSKPVHLASLGNELNLDDGPEKLTSSAGSSSSTAHATMEQQQPFTEIYFKTKSLTEMKRIFGLLQWKNSLIFDDSDLHGKQLAEPQKTAATASMPTATYCDENVQPIQQQQHHHHQQLQPPEYSPLSSTTSRSELETGDSISPVMKTRKSSSHKNIPDKDLGSPKAKNWKDVLFRRGGGSSSSNSGSHHHGADRSPSNLSNVRLIGSIGVPLKSCPMSKNNEYVPHIVDVCTNIVETKGLSVVGIYRIPGNKAAISELSEQVNKTDFSWDRCNTDVRWEDVNVVSSLLKLFIRSLPDALLPSSFYNNFIEADKKAGLERLKELKDLLESLPRNSYETMKHLIRHLNRVSKNCEVNLMEPKNLAIIFGPSIIRTPNDTLEIAVKDMKHQCRIVELLVTQYDYFFEQGEMPDVADICGNNSAACAGSSLTASTTSQEEQQTNMLLHNVSKIERLAERETTTLTARFIPALRRRTHSKRSGGSDTYSGESVSDTKHKNSLNTQNNTKIQNISKNFTSTPNICTQLHTPTQSLSPLQHQQNSQSQTTQIKSKKQSHQCVNYRQRRKAVPTIYDFGLTLRLHFQSLDYTNKATSHMASSTSSTNTTTASSSSINSTNITQSSTTSTTKKKERCFLGHTSRTHRKASLDEKDSGSGSGGSITKEQQRSSVDISILLTDDDSSNGRISDTGSMSLTTITDTLDTKLRNLRSGSESNDENGSPEFPKNRRHTLGQPLHMHSENIPYADESPERLFHGSACPLDSSNASTLMLSGGRVEQKEQKDQRQPPTSIVVGASPFKSNKLQHSATAPISSNLSSPQTAASTPTAVVTVKTTQTGSVNNIVSGSVSGGNASGLVGGNGPARNSYAGKNLRFSSSVYEQCCSEDDSEGSTTSDPKESPIIASPSFFLERYNKKRRDHRLFRSASFNCRNYSTRHGNGGNGGGVGGMPHVQSSLTKDEKTDMNLTKKRQIQNKQNRSIKRRHTVGGPHDYATAPANCVGCATNTANNCNHHHHHHHHPRKGSTTTTTTTVLRRIPIPSANGNIANNNNNNNNNSAQQQSDGSSNGNGSNSSDGGSGGNAATVSVAGTSGEHVLEVGIRIKNINRGRF